METKVPNEIFHAVHVLEDLPLKVHLRIGVHCSGEGEQPDLDYVITVLNEKIVKVSVRAEERSP